MSNNRLEMIENSMYGRKKSKNKKVRLPIYLLPDERDRLKKLCEDTGVTVSHMIRFVIVKHLLKD